MSAKSIVAHDFSLADSIETRGIDGQNSKIGLFGARWRPCLSSLLEPDLAKISRQSWEWNIAYMVKVLEAVNLGASSIVFSGNLHSLPFKPDFRSDQIP